MLLPYHVCEQLAGADAVSRASTADLEMAVRVLTLLRRLHPERHYAIRVNSPRQSATPPSSEVLARPSCAGWGGGPTAYEDTPHGAGRGEPEPRVLAQPAHRGGIKHAVPLAPP